MLSLILDSRFKTFHFLSSLIGFLSSLIGCEQGKAIVEEYNKKIFVSYAS
jgi:hypothetical protein